MESLGFFLTILIGLSLGVLGGGGSILTLPLLTLFFGYSVTEATGASLFLVGVTALVGSIFMARAGQVDFRTLATFGPASIVAVFLTRLWLLPAISDPLFSIGDLNLSRDQGLLLLFLALMLGTAYTMIRRPKPRIPHPRVDAKAKTIKGVAEGLVIGVVTGLVGAGGGFLIVPALVILAGLSMPKAVGTSLAIIAVKSLIGFGGDLLSQAPVQWSLLLTLSGLAILGILVGTWVRKFIPETALRPAFGFFILTIAVVMAIQGFGSVAAASATPSHQTQNIMSVQLITPQELQNLRASGADLQLVDVRGPDEREISVLSDDIHIVMDEIGQRVSELDPQMKTVVYCRSGQRSQSVAEYLSSLGFEDVSNLVGGINRWAQEVDSSMRTY